MYSGDVPSINPACISTAARVIPVIRSNWLCRFPQVAVIVYSVFARSAFIPRSSAAHFLRLRRILRSQPLPRRPPGRPLDHLPRPKPRVRNKPPAASASPFANRLDLAFANLAFHPLHRLSARPAKFLIQHPHRRELLRAHLVQPHREPHPQRRPHLDRPPDQPAPPRFQRRLQHPAVRTLRPMLHVDLLPVGLALRTLVGILPPLMPALPAVEHPTRAMLLRWTQRVFPRQMPDQKPQARLVRPRPAGPRYSGLSSSSVACAMSRSTSPNTAA